MQEAIAFDYESWRAVARNLLQSHVPPEEIAWRTPGETPSLFASADQVEVGASANQKVPKPFLDLAQRVCAHRTPEKWPLLYSLLWRLTHGEPQLLDLASDAQVYQLLCLDKEIRRDIHKMHAFVRFRICVVDGVEQYIAWYRPDHRIVRLAVPFFQRRFAAMRWAILTPDESAFWNGETLMYEPGLPREAAPAGDELEVLWRTYYGSIFNPARIKLKAMRKEMPVRFWDLLPETEVIPELLRQAPARVETMIEHQEGSAMSARLSSRSVNSGNIAQSVEGLRRLRSL